MLGILTGTCCCYTSCLRTRQKKEQASSPVLREVEYSEWLWSMTNDKTGTPTTRPETHEHGRGFLWDVSNGTDVWRVRDKLPKHPLEFSCSFQIRRTTENPSHSECSHALLRVRCKNWELCRQTTSLGIGEGWHGNLKALHGTSHFIS